MAPTREEFLHAMDNAEGFYVYFVDKNKRMHFVADIEYRADFCDSLSDAFLCTEEEAAAVKLFCEIFFPENFYQIVKLHINVEWC